MLDMIKIQPFPWASVIFAPFSSIPAAALVGLGSSDTGVGSDFFWGLFFGALLGVPTAFLGLLIIGVPAYVLLRRLNYLRVWVVCGIGAIVPFVLFLDAPLRTILMAVAAGVSVSVTAYMLRPKNYVLQFA